MELAHYYAQAPPQFQTQMKNLQQRRNSRTTQAALLSTHQYKEELQQTLYKRRLLMEERP